MQASKEDGLELSMSKGNDVSELHSEKRDKASHHLVEELEALCRRHLARSDLLKTIDALSALNLVSEQMRVNLVADTLKRTLSSVKIEI